MILLMTWQNPYLGNFVLGWLNDEPNGITKKTRHLSYYRANIDASKKFEIPSKAKGLRTFLGERWLSFLWCEYNDIVKMIDRDLFQKFKCLRVLSFSGENIRELPVSIGNLKHLRYLNIHNTRIKHLT